MRSCSLSIKQLSVHNYNTSKNNFLGTADIILDSCIDAWTGQDLAPLSEDLRKKILDFYQRASLSSYCTAFSYRPLLMPLPWKDVHDYLQLPSHTYPFYWQNAEMAEMADAVQNVGHISLGMFEVFIYRMASLILIKKIQLQRVLQDGCYVIRYSIKPTKTFTNFCPSL